MPRDLICTYCLMPGHRASQCPRRPRERDVERYLVQRVRAMGGEVRKVQWIGRRGAPDRLVLLPAADQGAWTFWAELKSPGKKARVTQQREHDRLRAFGHRVEVIDSKESVDRVLAWQ